MAAARGPELVAVLDVGSWKVSALIAERGPAGEFSVLGTGQRESRGVKRGFVADVEAAERAIRETVEQAERIAGVSIDSVHVGFSAGGLASAVRSVEIALDGHQVQQDDVDQLLEDARGVLTEDNRVVLHANPALYTLDGLTGVQKPVGLHADRLGVDVHVVAADASPLRNLDLCVRSAHLGVKAIVAAPVATGLACLTQEERELGVALVELGAGVTNVSLFAGGVLVGLASIAMGAADITDDIAAAFGVNRQQAERMKCFYGSALSSPRDNHDFIDTGDGAEAPRVSRAQLIAVIRQRLDQMIPQIAQAMKDMGFIGPIARQVVLTGGGAELKGIAEYVQSALGRSVRAGRPRGMAGLPDAHAGPAFATLAGLAAYAANEPVDLRRPVASRQQASVRPARGVINKLMTALKAGY